MLCNFYFSDFSFHEYIYIRVTLTVIDSENLAKVFVNVNMTVNKCLTKLTLASNELSFSL